MNITLWIVQGFLAVIYLTAGVLKVFMLAKANEQLPWTKRHSNGYVRFIGTVEILGAIGLVLPMLIGTYPWLTPVAALGLAILQILAILTEHLPNKEYNVLPFNLILLVLALFVAFVRFVGLP